MFETEKREHLRVLFYRGAIVLNHNDDAGEPTMDNIVIRDISLGGIGFEADSKCLYEKRKIYDLKLKADLPWKDVELHLKIAIIRTIKQENSESYIYGAVYRNLSNAQTTMLKEIIDYQVGLDGAVNRSPKKSAV